MGRAIMSESFGLRPGCNRRVAALTTVVLTTQACHLTFAFEFLLILLHRVHQQFKERLKELGTDPSRRACR